MTSMTRSAEIHQTGSTPSERLRQSMTAARLGFTWLGVHKSLNTSQKDQAANTFGAETRFVSAGKKLLDTAHPAFKAVTAIRSRAVNYWKENSLPYPEPGIRLIRQNHVEAFDQHMHGFARELEAAVRDLEDCYDELRRAAQERLGSLFNPSDYPDSLSGLFAIQHDYPSVEPPAYLQQLSPQLYRQECQRVQARFDEAVELAEQAFIEELSKLIDHLTERLSGEEDGKPRIFRDTVVTNLTDFFERFRRLNIRSNDQLDELVQRARNVIQGVEPQQLRNQQWLRQHTTSQMSVIQSQLDQLMVDRPRRNILRRQPV
jgi:hypothetical protein